MRGIYPARGRSFRPWKNGGGETAEILVWPAGADFDSFEWRISTARVAQDGAFSLFPGVDRLLSVIEGGAMVLETAGKSHRLDQSSAPIAFAGDVATHARLLGEPLLDFNVMLRRPLQASLRCEPLAAKHDIGLLLEDRAGCSRFDLVVLAKLQPALRAALIGAPALGLTFG